MFVGAGTASGVRNETPKKFDRKRCLSCVEGYLTGARENYEQLPNLLKKLSNFLQREQYLKELKQLLESGESSGSELRDKLAEGLRKFSMLSDNSLYALLGEQQAQLNYWSRVQTELPSFGDS